PALARITVEEVTRSLDGLLARVDDSVVPRQR
ncbi:MAG: hypothetical protein JWQ37_3352, partial [Blastococcus sp.]|nr:hypothetical protein [Blastococcus sp.]